MFWDNFVKLCNERGVKPNPVAKELKLSSGSVTAWKNGAEPRDTALQKIADYFGISVSELTKEKKPPNDGGEIKNEDAKTNEQCKDHFIINEDGSVKVFFEDDFELFQYSPCSKHAMLNFFNGEIYGTLPSDFNDPFDTHSFNENEKILSEVRKKVLTDIPDIGNNLDSMVSRLMEQLLNTITLITKKGVYVSCFSTKNNSAPMWGHYADKGRGFAVSYSPKTLYESAKNEYVLQANDYCEKYKLGTTIDSKNVKGLDFLVPIIYGKCGINTDDFCIRLLSLLKFENKIPYLQKNSLEILELLKIDSTRNNILMNKSEEWSYEKEWRLWGINNNFYEAKIPVHKKIAEAKASAVYLGYAIDPFDKENLLKSAAEKKIPAYKMELKSNTDGGYLHPELIYSPDKEETP